MPLSEREDVFPAVAGLPDGSWLRSYLAHCVTITDGNLGFHVLSGLTLLSQTIPPTLSIPYFGGGIRLNLFAMLVGPSTRSRKTTAVRIAARVLQNVRSEAGFVPPGSWQALRDLVIEQPQRLMLDEEFGNSLANMDQSYLRGMKSTFLELYDCTPISTETREKKRSKTLARTDNPRVSSLVAVADSLLEDYTSLIDWTGGYLGRFTTLYAGRGPRQKDMIVSNTDEENRLSAVLREYDGWRDAMNGRTVGACVGNDADASILFREFMKEIDRESDSAVVKIQPAIDRAPSMAQKIAGLLAWDFGGGRSGYDWAIGGREMEIAIKIARLHIKSVKEIGAALSTDPRERERRRVLRAVGKTPTPLYRIMQSNPGLIDWQLEKWLGSLIKDRSIVRIPRQVGDVEDFYRLRTPDDDNVIPMIAKDLFSEM